MRQEAGMAGHHEAAKMAPFNQTLEWRSKYMFYHIQPQAAEAGGEPGEWNEMEHGPGLPKFLIFS